LKQIKAIIIAAALMMLASVVSCGQDDKQINSADTGVLKTQLETLEQAKQVGQVVQDGAEQQRQKIAEETR
jgi:hypothetical protein